MSPPKNCRSLPIHQPLDATLSVVLQDHPRSPQRRGSRGLKCCVRASWGVMRWCGDAVQDKQRGGRAGESGGVRASWWAHEGKACKQEVEMEQPLEASSSPFISNFRFAPKSAKCLHLAKRLHVGQDCSLTGKKSLYIQQVSFVLYKIDQYLSRSCYIQEDCSVC